MSQGELAKLAGVSRQTVGGIEACQYGPSLTVALSLVRALGKTLEDVFWLQEEPMREVFAHWSNIGAAPDMGARIQVVRTGNGYTAYPAGREMLSLDANAFVMQRENDRLLRAKLLATDTRTGIGMILAGCSPVLGLLRQRLELRYRDLSLHWVNTNSMQSLEALKHGVVHVAGVHILDETTGEYNLPVIQRVLGNRPYVVYNLYHGEQGFLLPRGNPKGIRNFSDLLHQDVRVVNREPGAESRRILDAGLRADGIGMQQVEGYEFLVRSHQEVAQAVALCGADCGIALRPLAGLYELDFVPLTRERYDLVILQENVHEPAIQALLDTLQKHATRLELESGGYEPEATGRQYELSET
jgi:molybdate-binding protein/DNA-binding XRE family transcriptional regulator